MEYWQKYYKKNRKKILAKNRKWWKDSTPEQRKKQGEYANKWQKTHRQKVLKNQRNTIRRKRLKLISFLGGKCVKCGFSDWRALQIAHVNGGGTKELKKMGKDLYFKYYKMVLDDKVGKYQLLCANCNWIKRYENNETNRT